MTVVINYVAEAHEKAVGIGFKDDRLHQAAKWLLAMPRSATPIWALLHLGIASLQGCPASAHVKADVAEHVATFHGLVDSRS
jgi:hypothetical protein